MGGIIAIIILAVLVVLAWRSPTFSWDPMLRDGDFDGIPDLKDFKPEGNGWVVIVLSYFDARCANSNGRCDPKFMMFFDFNNDQAANEGSQFYLERGFDDVDKIADPDVCCSLAADLPDSLESFHFVAKVWDHTGNVWIDCFGGINWMSSQRIWPYSFAEWPTHGSAAATYRCDATWQVYTL